MVLPFFCIVPDGWALPEHFQHRMEGGRKENGTFLYFPSFCNFSAITKSHIAANFPASIQTFISQEDRNSSMRAISSSDPSCYWSGAEQCSPNGQLISFLHSGSLGPAGCLASPPACPAPRKGGSRSPCEYRDLQRDMKELPG